MICMYASRIKSKGTFYLMREFSQQTTSRSCRNNPRHISRLDKKPHQKTHIYLSNKALKKGNHCGPMVVIHELKKVCKLVLSAKAIYQNCDGWPSHNNHYSGWKTRTDFDTVPTSKTLFVLTTMTLKCTFADGPIERHIPPIWRPKTCW